MLRLQGDLAKGLLILRDVLSEDVPKRLGLLRAEVDALRVLDGHGFGCILMHESKGQEEIPYAHTHLHAVGVVFAVIGRLRQVDFGLRLLRGIHDGFRVSCFVSWE